MVMGEESLEAAFTLESEKSGIVEELPFRVLMMGDWAGDGERRPFSERNGIEIDRDNFDDVIRRMGVRLELDGMTLEFESLDDFHPDEIFSRVPEFAELRDLRRRLSSESTFQSAAREVREWFQTGADEVDEAPEPEPAPPASGSLLDSILSQPSGGGPVPRGAPGELGALVRDLVRPHLVSVDENEQRSLIGAVDESTSGLMRKILHDRRFQELEAAWRGLFLQVRRTETASDLKIFVLNVTKDELAEDLRSAPRLDEAAACGHIVETDTDEPWSMVCGNYAFGPTADDAATIARLAKLSAAAGAPFVAHMRPDIFGVRSLAEHPDPREWRTSADFDAGALWATLRGLPEARYLGMTMPRFLARLPYGADSEPLESFSFEEFTGPPSHEGLLWANACFIVATLFGQSYSNYGWDLDRSMVQDIDDLPLYMYGSGGDKIYVPCAEVQLTEAACERLMEYGLMPLVSYKNSDRAKLARFQSIAEPVTALRGRWSAR